MALSQKELRAILTAQDAAATQPRGLQEAWAKLKQRIQEDTAIGGAIKAGKPYLVGETGPELFTPRVSGTITPNRELKTDD